MPMYNMCVVFEIHCQYVFESWETTTELGLTLGSILSFLFTLLTVYISHKKKQMIPKWTQGASKQKKDIIKSLSFMTSYFLKLVVMFVLMTMSFWVILAVILGQTVGSVGVEVYEHKKKSMDLKDSVIQ